MSYSLSHVDTCLPCYLQDHHNRPGEVLLASSAHGDTRRKDVKAQLLNDMNSQEMPDGFDYDAATAAIEAWFDVDSDDALFDNFLEAPGEDDDDGEYCYAYFVLSYHVADDEA